PHRVAICTWLSTRGNCSRSVISLQPRSFIDGSVRAIAGYDHPSHTSRDSSAAGIVPPYGGSNPATPASQCGLPTRPPSYRERRAIPGHFSRGGFVSAHPFPRNSRQARPKSPTVIQNILKFRRGSAETKFDFGLRGRLSSA